MMLKSRLTYAGLLAAIFFLWVYCNNYASFTLLLAVIVFPVISLIMLLSGRKKITLEAIFPEYFQKEEKLAFEINIVNKAIVPAARVEFTVQMQNSLTLSSKTQIISVSMRARSSESYQVCVTPVYTGTLTFEVIKAEYYDCFGLFRFKVPVKLGQSVRVSANHREVPVTFEELFGTADDSDRYSEVKPGNDVSEVFDIHEYLPGDEIKKINWKLSVKYDQIIVRDFSLPQNSLLTIMLELSRAEEKLTDTCVELFLSLSKSLITAGIIHNIAWFDGGSEVFHHIEISDLETFEVAQMKLLESYGYEESGAALSYYLENMYHRSSNTVLYMAAEPDFDFISEASYQQPIIPLQPENELSELLVNG